MAAKLVSEFADYVLRAYDLQAVRMTNTVTLIGRRPYIAHPRVVDPTAKEASRHILNEEWLVAALQAARPDVKVQLVDLSPNNMSFKDQLRTIRQSRVLAAFHG